jgi:hypothetical protein
VFIRSSQRDFYRQDQQEILSTPIEIARSLPDDILRLTGYCKNRPLYPGIRIGARTDHLFFLDKAVGGVGFIGDHQDPAEFLHVDTNGVGKFNN